MEFFIHSTKNIYLTFILYSNIYTMRQLSSIIEKALPIEIYIAKFNNLLGSSSWPNILVFGKKIGFHFFFPFYLVSSVYVQQLQNQNCIKFELHIQNALLHFEYAAEILWLHIWILSNLAFNYRFFILFFFFKFQVPKETKYLLENKIFYGRTKQWIAWWRSNKQIHI